MVGALCSPSKKCRSLAVEFTRGGELCCEKVSFGRKAGFGVDRCRNAIHCTDLPEDGTLECEYFFSIQQDE